MNEPKKWILLIFRNRGSIIYQLSLHFNFEVKFVRRQTNMVVHTLTRMVCSWVSHRIFILIFLVLNIDWLMIIIKNELKPFTCLGNNIFFIISYYDQVIDLTRLLLRIRWKITPITTWCVEQGIIKQPKSKCMEQLQTQAKSRKQRERKEERTQKNLLTQFGPNWPSLVERAVIRSTIRWVTLQKRYQSVTRISLPPNSIQISASSRNQETQS